MSISVEQLRVLGPGFDPETQSLIDRFASIRATRQPLRLKVDEFDTILRWKLGRQYGRQQARRQANTDEIIRIVTGTAFTVTHPDPGYELELRVGILCTLRGVGVPVASAILALVYPEKLFEKSKMVASVGRVAA